MKIVADDSLSAAVLMMFSTHIIRHRTGSLPDRQI